MRESLGKFLQRELKPTTGRGNYALRLTLTCGVLILLFMTLHIPLLAVAIIVAFYLSQSNVVTISMLSIAFFLLLSVVIGIIVLMLKFTYEYPLVRLVCSSLLFFAAMFCMRIFGKAGLAFFIIALSVIFAQTFPSMTGNGELLIRMVLWLWVAANTAVLVTLLVNACFRQSYPDYQFRQQLAKDFSDCAWQLNRYQQTTQATNPVAATDVAKQFSRLQELFNLACRSSAAFRRQQERWHTTMAAAAQCYYLTMLIPPRDTDLDQNRQTLAAELSGYLQQIAAQCSRPDYPDSELPTAPGIRGDDVVLHQLAMICTRLSAGELVELPTYPVEKPPLMASDAWTNPVYPQFALKTLLATLLCYLFYTATDWEGIHTIMLSCVIVAQPGLGATMQKTWLRIAGALLATLLALGLMIIVQPNLASVTGLLVMVLPVMALSGWIAGGSERIAYAGIQIAFTFALAFLDWFGPLYNLTELRDRVIGILLGVLVSSVIHLYLWPESEAMKLKRQLSQLFCRLAEEMAEDKAFHQRQWGPVYQSLLATENLLNRVSAEPVSARVYPYPELREWPVEKSFVGAQEIMRLCEGYRLYSHDSPDFLRQCAPVLKKYAAQIEQATDNSYPQLPETDGNPYSQPLARAICALPVWGANSHQRVPSGGTIKP